MSAEETGFVYVATAKCGCRVGVCSEDMPDKERAKAIASFIRDGLIVEREPVAHFRAAPFGHKCDKKRPKPSPQTELLT